MCLDSQTSKQWLIMIRLAWYEMISFRLPFCSSKGCLKWAMERAGSEVTDGSVPDCSRMRDPGNWVKQNVSRSASAPLPTVGVNIRTIYNVYHWLTTRSCINKENGLLSFFWQSVTIPSCTDIVGKHVSVTRKQEYSSQTPRSPRRKLDRFIHQLECSLTYDLWEIICLRYPKPRVFSLVKKIRAALVCSYG